MVPLPNSASEVVAAKSEYRRNKSNSVRPKMNNSSVRNVRPELCGWSPSNLSPTMKLVPEVERTMPLDANKRVTKTLSLFLWFLPSASRGNWIASVCLWPTPFNFLQERSRCLLAMLLPVGRRRILRLGLLGLSICKRMIVLGYPKCRTTSSRNLIFHHNVEIAQLGFISQREFST